MDTGIDTRDVDEHWRHVLLYAVHVEQLIKKTEGRNQSEKVDRQHVKKVLACTRPSNTAEQDLLLFWIITSYFF